MPRIRQTIQGVDDQVQIVERIARDNPSAARRWIVELNRVFHLIAAHPEMGASLETQRFGPVRCHAFGNYVIYYRPITDGAEILRVVHGARDQEQFTS